MHSLRRPAVFMQISARRIRGSAQGKPVCFVQNIDKKRRVCYNGKSKIGETHRHGTVCPVVFRDFCRCILPALRELKQFALAVFVVAAVVMYLTRVAGIETLKRHFLISVL